MVYHYTQRKTVSLIYDNKQEMLVGGWLPVEYIQAGMLVTEGSGTFGDGIYTTPLEPSSFRDKETVCANNFGSQQHRKEKYGPGGEMSRLPDGKGWEWLDADGNSSPFGHHLVEVCLPLRVSVKDLTKVPNPYISVIFPFFIAFLPLIRKLVPKCFPSVWSKEDLKALDK